MLYLFLYVKYDILEDFESFCSVDVLIIYRHRKFCVFYLYFYQKNLIKFSESYRKIIDIISVVCCIVSVVVMSDRFMPEVDCHHLEHRVEIFLSIFFSMFVVESETCDVISLKVFSVSGGKLMSRQDISPGFSSYISLPALPKTTSLL